MWTEFNRDFNGNQVVNQSEESMQKKLIDQILVLNRRAEVSEYGASNYTQITDYHIGKHLGSGAYASVKMATHKASGMVLAIKVYEKSKLNEHAQRKLSVKREINALKKLQHENVMRLYDVIDSPKQLYIVLEHIQGQMLHSYIEKLLLDNNFADFTLSPNSVRPSKSSKVKVNLKGPI
jgi:serine/threonine protein kinase